MKDYVKVSGRKTVPDILNTKAPFVILRAMRNTPRVAAARISAELGSATNPKGLAIAIVYKRASAKGIKLKRAAAKSMAGKMIRARRAAVRYVSLGWLKALATWRPVAKPLKSSSLAAKGGYGKKATGFSHKAVFANAAPGAWEGEDALESSINAEARDMRMYAFKKMQRLANKYKGRRYGR